MAPQARTGRWHQRALLGDVLVGCAPQDSAEQLLRARRERVHRVHCAWHPDKTRRLACGRWARARRQRRGQGKPETVDFLGLTHIGSQTRTGPCTVRRTTVTKRLRMQVQESKQLLRERRHWPIRQLGAWRQRVLVGPYRYDGVPRNLGLLQGFRERRRR